MNQFERNKKVNNSAMMQTILYILYSKIVLIFGDFICILIIFEEKKMLLKLMTPSSIYTTKKFF